MGLKNIKIENQAFSKEQGKEDIGDKEKQRDEELRQKGLVEVKKRESKFKNLGNNVKEIALVVVAIGLIGLGYLNYSPEESVQVAAYQNEENLGDAKLVSSSAIVENDEEINNTNIESTSAINNENTENTINNSSETSEKTSSEQDYFSLTKLERDTMYSQTLETYQKMLDNEKLTNEQKAIAVQEISNVTEEKNAIKISENLIKNKGYEEVVILKNSDNVNVIVKDKKLETEDIAKIQNIVTRELKVDLDKINISCR